MKSWEESCDACGFTCARGLWPSIAIETLRETVHVTIARQEFAVCVDCIVKISPKFTADLLVAARECADFQLAEALEKSLRPVSADKPHLVEALRREMKRVRDLAGSGQADVLDVRRMQQDLEEAAKALEDLDGMRCFRLLERLKGWST